MEKLCRVFSRGLLLLFTGLILLLAPPSYAIAGDQPDTLFSSEGEDEKGEDINSEEEGTEELPYDYIDFDEIDENIGDDAAADFLKSLSMNSAQVHVLREPDAELSYSSATGMFRYTLPDGEWVEASVPNGAYSREAVSISCSEGVSNVSGYLDGAFFSPTGEPYRTPGSYIFSLWDFDVFGDSNTAYRVDYCFTIAPLGQLNSSIFSAPEGMEIGSAYLNGREMPVTAGHYVKLTQDGEWAIKCIGGGVSFETGFVRDTVPPRIYFTPEFEDGAVLNKTLKFNLQPDAAGLIIFLDGAEVTARGGQIVVNGEYRMEVSDAAGNTRTYDFRLKAGNQLPGWLWLVPLTLLAGGVLAAFISRRNMRVN